MPEEKEPREQLNPARRKEKPGSEKPQKDLPEEDVKGFQEGGLDPREPGGIAD